MVDLSVDGAVFLELSRFGVDERLGSGGAQ